MLSREYIDEIPHLTPGHLAAYRLNGEYDLEERASQPGELRGAGILESKGLTQEQNARLRETLADTASFGRSNSPRLFLFGAIALGLAGIACTVAADPKSPFLGEWTFHTKSRQNEAHLTLLKTGGCRFEMAEEMLRSCSWLTESNGEVTVNYGKYLSLSSASAKIAGDELTLTFGNDPEAFWVLTRVGSQKETDVLDYLEGETLVDSGDLEHGIARLTRSADHGNSGAQNSLAWTYATSKHPEALDAKKAIVYAEKAVADDRNYAYLDTLAAALARDGQFERAATTQEEALALLDKSLFGPDRESTSSRFKDRLALYREGKAYTEP